MKNQVESLPEKHKMIQTAAFTDGDRFMDIDVDFAMCLQLENIIWIDSEMSTTKSHPYFLNTTTKKLEKWDGWWVVVRKLFRPKHTLPRSCESMLEIEVVE